MQTPVEILKLRVRGLKREPSLAEKLSQLLRSVSGVLRADINVQKEVLRVISRTPLALPALQAVVRSQGFELLLYEPEQTHEGGVLTLSIEGMHCRSCEITIERKWKEIPGVKKVDVDASAGRARIVASGGVPNVRELEAAIREDGYSVRLLPRDEQKFTPKTPPNERPSLLQLLGLFSAIFLLGSLFSRAGFLRPNVALGSELHFASVFLLGLVAASSSCLAVAGGVMLSTAARFNTRYQNVTRLAAMRPVLLFIAGRLAAYALFGAAIGALSRALSPSPFVTGAITVVAALWMALMGLEMLGRAPRWALRLLPRMPKVISHRVLDAQNKEHPLVPAMLGAGTFFLPCGFTQALQLYVLTTGNAATGAMVLFAFALGTAPALLALGWVSSTLKGNVGKFFFQFSGALVVLLGFWNIQNGFSIAGYPLRLPEFRTNSVSASDVSNSVEDPNVTFTGSEQVMRMTVAYRGYGPNRFTIRAGVPTRWVVEAQDSGGCLAVLQSPRLGIREFLRPGRNEIAFTPSAVGTYPFSCSMGMFRGLITVVPNT